MQIFFVNSPFVQINNGILLGLVKLFFFDKKKDVIRVAVSKKSVILAKLKDNLHVQCRRMPFRDIVAGRTNNLKTYNL